ncbi:MAG: DUF2283 domain-containing protein [Anaerolineae bacterium]
MQIKHDTSADAMYIKLNDKPFHKNKVVGNGLVVLDIAEDGTVIGIELISPSLYVDNLGEVTYLVDSKQKTVSHSEKS